MPEHAQDDSALMLRLQAGEDTALNELMTRWQTPLVSFIYRYIGNQTDALDLAQETFVRVFESRHRYRAKAKFSTWLFTIASNLSRNYIRWQQRHPTVALDVTTKEGGSLVDSLPSENESPSAAAARIELAAALREHVHALPHDLKTAVLLFAYEDLSYEDIASVLRCTKKAVETRLYRARAILRESLSEWKSS